MATTVSPAQIDIRIGRVDQLFQTFDPSPFRERDLDPDATAFIVDWARELNRRVPIEIHLNVKDSGPERDAPEDVSAAIHCYFEHRAEVAERELRELFRFGRIYLAIGLVILVLALFGAEVLVIKFGERPSLALIAESLIILGWVVNWRPLEIFLYEWRPIRRDANLFRRLAAARIKVQG
ncbi:MAG: hypothetical protein K9L82_18100 [Chromatiaceae bacterium]|nr:hypothetical protein [Chromatiaceae bacterium]MCF7994514.1 hypothetical protein [Chromatiaceae bacterium]